MNSVLYQYNGRLLHGAYVPGQYRWSFAVRLAGVLLVCRPPVSGTLTLTLELNGVASQVRLAVPAGSGVFSRTLDFSLKVPAGVWVRWRAAFDGVEAAAAMEVSLRLQGVPESVASATETLPALTVQWISANTRLTLWEYDPETHRFSESVAGISTGRATLVQTSERFSISLGAVEVLRVASETLSAPEFTALGGIAAWRSPRLVFCRNQVALAALDAQALRVPELLEDDPEILTPSDAGFYDRFEFYTNGVLSAVLNASGWTARNITEPVPL